MIKNKLIILSVLEALLGVSADGMLHHQSSDSLLVPGQRYIKMTLQMVFPENMPLDQMASQIINEFPDELQQAIIEVATNSLHERVGQVLERKQNALELEHQKSDERLAKINKLSVTCNDLRIQRNRDAERIRKLEMQLAAKDRSTETKLKSATKKAPFKPLDPRLERNIKANILGILNTHHYLSGKIDSTLKYLWKLGLVAKTLESKHVVSNTTFYSAKSSDGTLYTPATTKSPCLWEQMFLHVDATNIAGFDDSVLHHNQ